MEQQIVYSPLMLQAQAARVQEYKSSHGHNLAGEYVMKIVREAQRLPAPLQKALAFTIPTSQLLALLALIGDNTKPAIQQMAYLLVQHRLRSRLAGPIWHYFQSAPDRPEFADLLKSLSRIYVGDMARSDRRANDWHACMGLLARPDALAAPVRSMVDVLHRRLIEDELTRLTCSEMFRRMDMDLVSYFVQTLLVKYFSACAESDFANNLNTLVDLLDISSLDLWPVINNYYQTVWPESLDDQVGQRVYQKLMAAQTDDRLELADLLNPAALKHFKSWQILFSLRRHLKHEKQIELLSRYYHIFLQPAEILPDVGVVIRLHHMTLLARTQDEHLYLYPLDLFDQSFLDWRAAVEQRRILIEESAKELDDDTGEEEGTEDPLNRPITWPLDQDHVIPTRIALLNEQDKGPEEPTLVDELVRNQIMSIIQLTLDDAHYLFARKIFDEISLYEGLVKD